MKRRYSDIVVASGTILPRMMPFMSGTMHSTSSIRRLRSQATAAAVSVKRGAGSWDAGIDRTTSRPAAVRRGIAAMLAGRAEIRQGAGGLLTLR